jgi:trehalose/maltose transport system substrate-binding protein
MIGCDVDLVHVVTQRVAAFALRQRALALGIVVSFIALTACGEQRDDAHPVVTLSCGAVGVELQLCTEEVHRWERQTGNRVRIVSTPNSSTERLALYQQLLASHSDEIDVLQVDVVWPGILASHLIDLHPYFGSDTSAHFPALMQADRVHGRLVAIPWWIGTGILYYRADLLDKYGFAPPDTWQDLTTIARAIMLGERRAGHRRMWGYVWQGAAYEGLTCNALEWIDSFGGGQFVDDDGDVTVDNPHAIAAVSLATSWVGDISPSGVLNYDEEAARGVFQTGNAVFMRNWPYAWTLAQNPTSAVRGKVGIAPLPRGGANGTHSGALGGWNLAVSRYSRHPALAAQLVHFLTSTAEQKRRALEGGYAPTRVALYHDPDVLAANPIFRKLLPAFEQAVPRPSQVTGTWYNRVSYDVSRSVHHILAHTVTPADGIAQLDDAISEVRRRARWSVAATQQ